jgi:thioesterase domain-containing protein/acyl carrier protein
LLPGETTIQIGSREKAFSSVSAPTDHLEGILAGWWQELLGLDTVELDDDFFDLGGHSLTGVQLFQRIKTTYGVNLALSALFEVRTIRLLAQQIRQEEKSILAQADPRSPVIPIQPHGSQPPIFWIPGGYGTTVLPFREVALLLGSNQPVYGLEAKMPPPGQELESIPDRAARFVRDIRAVQPIGPYSLVGWCGGGYIAFEMAQELSRNGQTVDFLAIVECAVPGYPTNLVGKIRFLAERTISRFQNFLKRGPKGMAGRTLWSLKSFAEAMHMRSGSAGTGISEKRVTPPPAPIDEMDERAWRNVNRYHPVSYSGKCVVIHSKYSWAYRGVSSSVDPRLAWCELSKGGSEIRTVPGDHMEILKAPNSYRFAEELKDCLERSRAYAS